MTQLDVNNAKRALGARLQAWGITDDPSGKAVGFIDDLVSIGWQMSPNQETRIRPPRKDEECAHHPGQWASVCGGCRSDKLAYEEPSAEVELPPNLTGVAAVRAVLATVVPPGQASA